LKRYFNLSSGMSFEQRRSVVKIKMKRHFEKY